MKAGYLSEFFAGVAAKTLSAVEADAARSRQHEFNGSAALRGLLGDERQRFEARFIYLSDGDPDPVVDDGYLTWYNSRVHKEGKKYRSPEYRLYFPKTAVSQCAAEGDLLVLAKRPDGRMLVIIVQGGSTIANQILWLFRVDAGTLDGYSIREELETDQDRIRFASTFILNQIGIEPDPAPEAENYLETMLRRFGGKFPPTGKFSKYARSTVKELNAADDPDAALIGWMEREEILFRTLERHLLADRLSAGFTDDVDGFIAFSLSVQNRRKSRVGQALENHLEEVFTQCGVRYERGGRTEGRARPDFLFPGTKEYRDPDFSTELLTMLGVKTTCKDRWRQVLAEAQRINRKHLLTLETAISTHQTHQMREHDLQLVIPRSLQNTFTAEQQAQLIDLRSFTAIVRERGGVVTAAELPL